MTDRDLMKLALDALEIAEVDGNCCYEATELLRTRLAQPEQEPVAWLYRDSWGVMKLSQVTPPPVGAFPVYTTPPQRKPLSDEWIHRTTILMGFNPEWTTEIGIAYAIVRAAEAAHGVKGDR